MSKFFDLSDHYNCSFPFSIDAGVPIAKTRPSAGSGDGEVISEDEDLARNLKLAPEKPKSRQRSRSINKMEATPNKKKISNNADATLKNMRKSILKK